MAPFHVANAIAHSLSARRLRLVGVAVSDGHGVLRDCAMRERRVG